MLRRVAIAVLVFALSTPCFALKDEDRAELSDIRATALLISPELEKMQSPLVVAIALRDQIYRTGVPMGVGVPPLTSADFQDWSEAYRLSQLSRERANACNGKSILYMLALRAFGIQSRMVALYASVSAGIPVWSHASVDVRIDGNWVAMDPTFNIGLKDGAGAHMSWATAIAMLRNGDPVVPHSDGKLIIRGQTLESYRETYGGDLRLLSEFAILGPWQKGEAENLNPGWDGKIRYIDGAEYDAWNSLNSDFYKRIVGQE